MLLLLQTRDFEEHAVQKFIWSGPVLVFAIAVAWCISQARRDGMSRRSAYCLLFALAGPFFISMGIFAGVLMSGSGAVTCSAVGALFLFVPVSVILGLLGLRDLKRNPRQFRHGKTHALAGLGISGAVAIFALIMMLRPG